MFILIVCFAAFLIGCLLATSSRYDWREPVGVIMASTAAVAFLIGAATVPINRMGVRAYIAAVEASRMTKAVDVSDPIEGAAWRMYAAKTNAGLAEWRYYNKGPFDIWIPDEVESVKPIQ